jgi:hypothetical protein
VFFRKRRKKRPDEGPGKTFDEEYDDDFGYEREGEPRSVSTSGSRGPSGPVESDPTPAIELPPDSYVARGPDDATFVPRSSGVRPAVPLPPDLAPDRDAGDSDLTQFIGLPTDSSVQTVAWLVVAKGVDRGRDYRLQANPTSVGTAPQCHVRLPEDPYASAAHAELIAEGGGWRVRDLGSTNGSFRNGERINEVRLEDDDRLRFGTTEFVYKACQLGA